jgi:hypothetical protein
MRLTRTRELASDIMFKFSFRTGARLAAVIALSIAAIKADSSAQPDSGADANPPPEFQFVRLAYTATGLQFGRRDRWLTDWPDAERYLISGVKRLTRIAAADDGIYLSVMDERLFDYPWLYAVEVGGWSLNDMEAARLRDYLLRGGFLMVDDFHGSLEWAGFVETMRRVFPDRTIVDVPTEDPIFHVAYDLNERTQIPGIQFVYSGVPYERDGFEPQWRGIYDDEGRLMVMINFNMDLGDAWEHADVPEYALQYTTRAYQYAINYILYAMTH